MPRQTVLENKIRWYFKNIEKKLDITMFEVILASDFDEEGKLVLTQEKLPRKFQDILVLAMRLGNKES